MRMRAGGLGASKNRLESVVGAEYEDTPGDAASGRRRRKRVMK